MSPDTLQTLGILAIGLGFVLIGLGGFSTYTASQKLQHASELRQVQQQGEFNAQVLSIELKNQQMQIEDLRRRTEPPAAAPASEPPVASYYRPPAPPAPSFSPPPPTFTPPPVAEGPPEAENTTSAPVEHETSAPPATEPTAMPPEATLDPMAPRNSDWEEPETMEPELPMRYLSVRQQHVIADTLRAHGRHVVTIESSYGDPVSREFAQELGTSFLEADWTVKGIDEHKGLPLASGVTVSAASFPPQPETRAVYEALLSAGIAVTQQLDPKQTSSETVILVGAPL